MLILISTLVSPSTTTEFSMGPASQPVSPAASTSFSASWRASLACAGHQYITFHLSFAQQMLMGNVLERSDDFHIFTKDFFRFLGSGSGSRHLHFGHFGRDKGNGHVDEQFAFERILHTFQRITMCE